MPLFALATIILELAWISFEISCLEFDVSLELGAWFLELSPPFDFADPATHRSALYLILRSPTPLPSPCVRFHTQPSRSLPHCHNQSPVRVRCTLRDSAQ